MSPKSHLTQLDWKHLRARITANSTDNNMYVNSFKEDKMWQTSDIAELSRIVLVPGSLLFDTLSSYLGDLEDRRKKEICSLTIKWEGLSGSSGIKATIGAV